MKRLEEGECFCVDFATKCDEGNVPPSRIRYIKIFLRFYYKPKRLFWVFLVKTSSFLSRLFNIIIIIIVIVIVIAMSVIMIMIMIMIIIVIVIVIVTVIVIVIC